MPQSEDMTFIVMGTLMIAIVLYLNRTQIRENFASVVGGKSVVKHGIAVTNQPPTLPEQVIPWLDRYAGRSMLNKINAAAYVNYFPMTKPPADYEVTMSGTIDVARAQFVPHTAAR